MSSGAIGELSSAGFRLTGLDSCDAVVELVQRCRVPIEIPLLNRRQSVATQRSLRESGEVMCQGSCFDQSLTWFDEAIGKPHALSFVARNAATREDHVHCTTVSNQAGQADRPEVHERNAETATVDSEHRIASGNTQIAPERKL